ncbi:MAG: nitrite/sulfite reductase [Chlamydiae bacterium]|nr:nitrite/sulfite reductase [Chlamydiota bacterium]MBI3266934.1 nitrite/sulfite reductase [Chlamydiota bacterium]
MKNTSQAELDRFEISFNHFMEGRLDFEEFRKVRVWQGVYSYRGTSDKYMIRIKIPQGMLSPLQMERVADLSEEYSAIKGVHLTTRQGLELYGISEDHLMKVLRSLADVDLTSRETGGNGVRNVTTCPFSGIARDELFDVTPYAQAVSKYFLRNPLTQGLPRKIKIAFEGCPADHIHAMIHDIGVFAVMRGAIRGFEVYVGGGLGGAPREAQLLENFTPAEFLLITFQAILAVFNQHGSRQNKDRSRLKFLIKDWGIERFKEAVQSVRQEILFQKGGTDLLEKIEEAPKRVEPRICNRPRNSTQDLGALDLQKYSTGKFLHASVFFRPIWLKLLRLGSRVYCKIWVESGFFKKDAFLKNSEFERWEHHNTLSQKQAEFRSVFIRCFLGDITGSQLRRIAEISRRFCEGRVRTTITQNLLLRWVHQDDLPFLYRELKSADLADCCAEHVMDITRCAGADSCISAITRSRGLAVELGKIFSNGLSHDSEIFKLRLKVSGCPHGCSQHSIADLGFHGASRTLHGRVVPHYQIMTGGFTEKGRAQFAKNILSVPARKVPEAVTHLLRFYLGHRNSDESLQSFFERIGFEKVRNELNPFALVPPPDEAPEIYKDWGSDQDYRLEAKKGECSA